MLGGNVLPVLLAVSSTLAVPIVERGQGIAALASWQVASFMPYSHFAAAAYCNPSTTLNWTCGDFCDANPGFKPVASGGDGGSVQFWFVGFERSLGSVIVAHQGTDPFNFKAVLTDANVFERELDQNLFPGTGSDLKVHAGFSDAHESAAWDVLSAVKRAMSKYHATRVTLTGHSLGGALALLDSIFLPLHLPQGTTFKAVTYGMPRVGNDRFADHVDRHVDLTHINNKYDPIPALPPLWMGYHHSSGEVHISSIGEWDRCPGHDNADSRCTVGTIQNLAQGWIPDHLGPYDGVSMGNCW